MSGYQVTIVCGNLGADPDIRYLENGTCCANLSVATSRKWTNKDTGEMNEKTEWHRVVLWRKLAEIAEKWLHKGSTVLIEGRLETRKWTDTDGNDRWTTEIVGENMTMLGGKQSRDNVPHPAEEEVEAEEKPKAKKGKKKVNDIDLGDEDDDLPF